MVAVYGHGGGAVLVILTRGSRGRGRSVVTLCGQVAWGHVIAVNGQLETVGIL